MMFFNERAVRALVKLASTHIFKPIATNATLTNEQLDNILGSIPPTIKSLHLDLTPEQLNEAREKAHAQRTESEFIEDSKPPYRPSNPFSLPSH